MKKGTSEREQFLTWTRNGDEVVRLAIEEFNGQMLVHLRTYSRGKNGTLYPTVRGVTIPHHKLAPLRKALRRVEKKLKRRADSTRPTMNGTRTSRRK